MAFVPDEALRDRYEISLSAFWLYTIICGCTDRKTGKTWPSRSTWNYVKSEYIGLSRSSFFACRNELIKEKWIEFDGQVFTPLKGKFYKNEAADKQQIVNGNGTESRTVESRIADSKMQNNGLDNPESRTVESRIADSHIYESPKSIQSDIQTVSNYLSKEIDRWTLACSEHWPDIDARKIEIAVIQVLVTKAEGSTRNEPIKSV